jgi:hypothetical protein
VPMGDQKHWSKSMPSSALFKVQTAINNKFQRIVVLLCYYHLRVET